MGIADIEVQLARLDRLIACERLRMASYRGERLYRAIDHLEDLEGRRKALRRSWERMCGKGASPEAVPYAAGFLDFRPIREAFAKIRDRLVEILDRFTESSSREHGVHPSRQQAFAPFLERAERPGLRPCDGYERVGFDMRRRM